MSIELPDGWRAAALGSFAHEVRGRSQGGEEVLSVTKHGGFVPSLEYFGKQVFSKDTDNYKVVRRGQYAYATIHLDEGSIDCLRIRDEGIISPMYTVFDVDDRVIDRSFLLEFLQTPMMLQRYAAIGEGSVNRRKSISFDTLASETLHLPPLREQKKIAAILSSVDEAIQATQAVIEQTRRVKEGLLQDLLTRGIGHTRFKQTEIGEIPESWELVRVSDAVSRIIDYRGKTPPYSESGVPVISQEDVQATGLMPSQKWVSHETASQWKHRGTLEPGDVVFRMERFVGEVAQVPDEQLYIITRGVLALRPAPALFVKDYFFWLFFHKKRCGDWDRHGHATTVPRMYKPDLLAQSLPRPPIQEQKRISAQMESVEKLIAAEVAKLRPLRRVKAGLLQDLLTGKVRVSP